MKKGRLFIIHGFMATPQNHWFQWLKEKIESDNLEVFLPEMPDSDSPDAGKWSEALKQAVGDVDENTWFVGHSLGCITILRYLTQQSAGNIAGGIVMVSGFSEPVQLLSELDAFTSVPLDNLSMITQIPHRAIIASLNDDIVPPDYSLRLSQQINAPLYGLTDSGHFLDRDGFTSLPLVEDLLRKFIR